MKYPDCYPKCFDKIVGFINKGISNTCVSGVKKQKISEEDLLPNLTNEKLLLSQKL